MDITNNVIVITGASSGFGADIARQAVAAGARVVLAARSASALEQLADELGRDRSLVQPTDVTSDADVARLAEATFERFGRADVLVNNAGFGLLDRIADASPADLQAMIDVNLYGAAHCTHIFLPHMLARNSGQIVLMASLAGLIATANMAYYNASKFALVGFGRTLMLELQSTGVRCAMLCPGVAQTGFQRTAPLAKYSRASRIAGFISSEQVAHATLRAIRRRTHGEVIIPGRASPLAAFGAAFPNITRRILHLLG